MGFSNPGRAPTQKQAGGDKKARHYGTSATQSNRAAASIAHVKPGLLAEAIDLATLAGDLVSFTRTTDGGAWCIYVKSGADTYKFYPHDVAELEETLAALCEGAR